MPNSKKNLKYFLYSNAEKGFSNIFSYFLSFSILQLFEKSNIFIPYYHLVSDNRSIPHTKHLFRHRDISQFKNDLDFFLIHFEPISLFDLIDSIKNHKSFKKKSFLLTFDDGYREIYNIVAPILKSKGIAATCFLTTDFLDNKNLSIRNKASILLEKLYQEKVSVKKKVNKIFQKYNLKFTNLVTGFFSIPSDKIFVLNEIADLLNISFSEYLKDNKPYLSSSQVKKLLNSGFTIGSHSLDHLLYSRIKFKEQIHQTINSTKTLGNNFLINYRAFAFPYSDHSVSKEFYENLNKYVDIFFGTSGLMRDNIRKSIQRFPMENDNFDAERILKKLFLSKIFRICFGINQIKR